MEQIHRLSCWRVTTKRSPRIGGNLCPSGGGLTQACTGTGSEVDKAFKTKLRYRLKALQVACINCVACPAIFNRISNADRVSFL